jgi:hypothetical protein
MDSTGTRQERTAGADRAAAPILEGGRIFALCAGLGGAAMCLGAILPWAAVTVSWGVPSGGFHVPLGIASADGAALLVLGISVIVGAVTFAIVRSMPWRIAAGVVVLVAGTSGLVITSVADPLSFAGQSLPAEAPCHSEIVLWGESADGRCPVDVDTGVGLTFARIGAILAAAGGAFALLRFTSKAPPPIDVREFAAIATEGGTGGPRTTRRRPLSDAAFLGWIVVVLLVVGVVGVIALTVIAQVICSQPTEWC